jgi:hypothetical protein
MYWNTRVCACVKDFRWPVASLLTHACRVQELRWNVADTRDLVGLPCAGAPATPASSTPDVTEDLSSGDEVDDNDSVDFVRCQREVLSEFFDWLVLGPHRFHTMANAHGFKMQCRAPSSFSGPSAVNQRGCCVACTPSLLPENPAIFRAGDAPPTIATARSPTLHQYTHVPDIIARCDHEYNTVLPVLFRPSYTPRHWCHNRLQWDDAVMLMKTALEGSLDLPVLRKHKFSAAQRTPKLAASAASRCWRDALETHLRPLITPSIHALPTVVALHDKALNRILDILVYTDT